MVISTDLLRDFAPLAPPDQRATPDLAAIRESPLIVGLFGHRELTPSQLPRLSDAVAAFIAEIREHLPDTELRAIIGLTRGCDMRYVCRALDIVSRVEIVLPMPLEECSKDFDADALKTLRALLMNPKVSSTVLSAPEQPLGIGGSVLLTLWDEHSPLRGGIPNAALRHVGIGAEEGDASLVMLALADDVDAADSVVQWTPGAGNAALTRMPPQLLRQLVDLNTYNRDYRRLRSSPAELTARGPTRRLALDDRPALEAIDAEYGKADALALRYAVAETLRVTFYLRLLDVDHRLDAARVLDAHAADRRTPDLRRSRFVEREWLQGQHRYFVAKVSQLKRQGRRVKTLKNALFATVVLVIAAMVLSEQAMEHYEIVFGVSLKNAVTFAWGVLALLLGAWQLHDNNKATRELLLQYRNQGVHFAHAGQQLALLTDAGERDHILVELGRDSLMEIYLWTIHRYHREHEPAGKR